MRQKHKIHILLIPILILIGCSPTNRISDSEIENRALKISELYDSTNIEIFKTWNYTPRGQAGIWFRKDGDSSLYHCVYIDQIDSAKMMIMGYDNFIKDFKINMSYDTAYWRISLNRQINGLITIVGVNHHGQDIVIKENIEPDSLFKISDPFDKFKTLTELKDSLKIYGIHNYERLGGFIQFNLSEYHILTYIPNLDSLNPKYKQIWIKEFEKGTMIKNHWNLRKLDEALDNG